MDIKTLLFPVMSEVIKKGFVKLVGFFKPTIGFGDDSNPDPGTFDEDFIKRVLRSEFIDAFVKFIPGSIDDAIIAFLADLIDEISRPAEDLNNDGEIDLFEKGTAVALAIIVALRAAHAELAPRRAEMYSRYKAIPDGAPAASLGSDDFNAEV